MMCTTTAECITISTDANALVFNGLVVLYDYSVT